MDQSLGDLPAGEGAPEGKTLTYEGGVFRLGGYTPHIVFTQDKLVIGCKEMTAEAADELCRRWTEFREARGRKVIQ